MNEYDSEKMADVLNAAYGMEPTDDPAQADIILFNTCSVREKAQEKVFHDLGRVRHLKDNNPEDKEKGILTGDRVHLNEAGNKLVAETMLKMLAN